MILHLIHTQCIGSVLQLAINPAFLLSLIFSLSHVLTADSTCSLLLYSLLYVDGEGGRVAVVC